MSTVGIDIGASKTLLVYLDETGEMRHHVQWKTFQNPNLQRDSIIDHVLRLKEEGASATSLGIGVAGQVDPEKGVIRWAPNLGWKQFFLGNELEEKLSIPVLLTNDVRAAAFGEWQVGAGKGEDNLLCLFIGTGVGGGVVVSGKLLEGHSSTAAEVGHMIVSLDGPLCSCGMQGCLEAFCGGWAIAKLSGMPTAREAIEAAKQGNVLCQSVVDNGKRALSKGIISLIHVLNPRMVILGGGILQGLPNWIPEISEDVFKWALKASLKDLKIVPASLGVFSCAIGAGLLSKSLPLHRQPL